MKGVEAKERWVEKADALDRAVHLARAKKIAFRGKLEDAGREIAYLLKRREAHRWGE